jgi:hypothetical protein
MNRSDLHAIRIIQEVMIRPDPIVDEVHRIRRKIAKQFGYDLHAICDEARKRDKKDGRKTVRLPPRPAVSTRRAG